MTIGNIECRDTISSEGEREQDEEIEAEHRHGQQQRVDAVEDAAVARQDVARVLHAQRALDLRLHKVAPGAGDAHHGTHTQQRREGHAVELRGEAVEEYRRGYKAENEAAEKALPRFLGRDALEELVAPDQRPHAEGAGIAQPYEDEHGQRHILAERHIEQAQQRQRPHHINLTQHRVGQMRERVAVLHIKLTDEAQYEVAEIAHAAYHRRRAVEKLRGRHRREQQRGPREVEKARSVRHKVFIRDADKLVQSQKAEEHSQSPEPPAAGQHRPHYHGHIQDTCHEPYQYILHIAVRMIVTHVQQVPGPRSPRACSHL